MTIICKEIEETEEEKTYNAFCNKRNLGTMSHRKGTGIWLVRNADKTKWHTCDLIECVRVVFFPQSTEEILFVDGAGNSIEFPTED
jgi:hypothetical protein